MCHTCEERYEEAKEEEDKKKVKLNTYVGGTAKSMHEREGEHVYEMKNLNLASHMLKHVVEGENAKEVEFRMKVLKFHKSSFKRQVSEAVSIQSIRMGNNLLKSKSEFNRRAVPRLALKLRTRNVAKASNKNAQKIIKMDEGSKDTEEKAVKMEP